MMSHNSLQCSKYLKILMKNKNISGRLNPKSSMLKVALDMVGRSNIILQ